LSKNQYSHLEEEEKRTTLTILYYPIYINNTLHELINEITNSSDCNLKNPLMKLKVMKFQCNDDGHASLYENKIFIFLFNKVNKFKCK